MFIAGKKIIGEAMTDINRIELREWAAEEVMGWIAAKATGVKEKP